MFPAGWQGEGRRETGRQRPSAVPSPRRVRGVLSPYRERGNSALARPNGGVIPAYAGMTGKGDTWRRGLRPVYGAIAPNGFLPTQE